ncbi:MAG TPA: hypothetical protein VEF53_17955, partial [Patescibacteria group bacterium]|nr:hypothetical protein [Patescibacteria group bacterium]
YTLMKVFQGVAAAVYTYFLFDMMGAKQAFNVFDPVNVSQYVRYLNSGFTGKISDSTVNLFFVLALMLVFSLVNKKRVKA